MGQGARRRQVGRRTTELEDVAWFEVSGTRGCGGAGGAGGASRACVEARARLRGQGHDCLPSKRLWLKHRSNLAGAAASTARRPQIVYILSCYSRN